MGHGNKLTHKMQEVVCRGLLGHTAILCHMQFVVVPLEILSVYFTN